VKTITECVFVVAVAAITLFVVTLQNKQDAEDLDAQTRWFKAHDCKRKSYLAGPSAQPIYLCDDGIEYIWIDIPKAPE
jgi:hypothetical protein